jgi:hypothetical protein
LAWKTRSFVAPDSKTLNSFMVTHLFSFPNKSKWITNSTQIIFQDALFTLDKTRKWHRIPNWPAINFQRLKSNQSLRKVYFNDSNSNTNRFSF